MASAKCAGAEVCETDANSCCKVDLCIASIVDTATTDSTTPEAITSTAPETTFSTTANSDSTTPEAITSTIANSDPTTTEVTTLTTPEATSSTTESTTTNTGSTSNEDSTISTSDGISSTPDSDSEAPTTEANGSTTEDSNSGGSPSTCTGFGVALVIGCLIQGDDIDLLAGFPDTQADVCQMGPPRVSLGLMLFGFITFGLRSL
ncbi:uncharacterized protein Dwil_GK27607 [Drosophila willistoni]|uniref:Uncharacterized protein n=1 Tax=Drosophila willistoni TaxID=7260 RepID=A0A0Q9WPV9_DROWI|nr:uncharacterized protein Dwil_GK27607 [Drosophila willistoni]